MSKLDDIKKNLESMKSTKPKSVVKSKAKAAKATVKKSDVKKTDKPEKEVVKTQPVKAVKKPAKSRKDVDQTSALEVACQEFVLNGGDRSKAYRKAFPATLKWKDESLWARASLFFTYDKVRIRIFELREEATALATEKFKVDAAYVLNRLVEIDQMDFAEILNDDGSLKFVKDWPKSWRTLISGFDIMEMSRPDSNEEAIALLKKIKWPDKHKNIELLGKHVSVGAFRDQLGIGDPDGNPFAINSIRLVGKVEP